MPLYTEFAGSEELPFERLPRLAIFQDSYGQYFHWFTAGHWKTLDQAAFGWMLAIIGYHRFELAVLAGVGGNTGQMMRDRFQRDIVNNADKFDICLGGQSCANDFFGFDLSVDQAYTPSEYIINELNKLGKYIGWIYAVPQGTGRSNYTQARQDREPQYNRKMTLLQSKIPGLRMLPSYRSVVNMNDTTAGAPRTNMLGSDNIHYLGPGALAFGMMAAPVIQDWFPDIVRNFNPREGNTDGYSGNYLPVGMPVLAGTPVAVSGGGTGVSGVCPPGFTLARNGNPATPLATCVGAMVADPDGDWFQMTINWGGATALEQFQFTVATANSFHAQVAAGDLVDYTAEYEIDCSGGGKFQRFIHRMLHQYNGVIWATGTVYAAGALVRAGASDGNVYRAVTGGTSGATKPTHTSGQVSDGGVVWEYVSARLLVMDWNGTNNIDADYTVGSNKLRIIPGTLPQTMPWAPGLSQTVWSVAGMGSGSMVVRIRLLRPRKKI